MEKATGYSSKNYREKFPSVTTLAFLNSNQITISHFHFINLFTYGVARTFVWALDLMRLVVGEFKMT